MDPSAPLDSIATTKVIFDRIYPFFGVAREFTSDRGPQFISKVWRDLWEFFRVQVNLTTAYTPHSNGAIKRQNHIIIKMLRTSLDGLGNTWEELLPHVQFNMNSAYVSSLGMTPFKTLFGFYSP